VIALPASRTRRGGCGLAAGLEFHGLNVRPGHDEIALNHPHSERGHRQRSLPQSSSASRLPPHRGGKAGVHTSEIFMVGSLDYERAASEGKLRITMINVAYEMYLTLHRAHKADPVECSVPYATRCLTVAMGSKKSASYRDNGSRLEGVLRTQLSPQEPDGHQPGAPKSPDRNDARAAGR
jgi:hypothetical protein